MSKILANEIANYNDDSPIDIKEGLNIPAGKPLQAAGSNGSSGQVLTTTGTTVGWVTPFDGDYNTLINRPSIPAAQVNSDWNASGGAAVILNKPAVPPLPSITTASAGSAALAYNSGNGEFTFTPPDLSSYATETWVEAKGYLTTYTETDPVFSASDAAAVTSTKISNWDTSYGWGNHASAGYLTAEADTLQAVVDRGNTCTSPVYITNKLYFSNNFATLTDLQAVNASTYHGMFAHVHAEGHGYFAHGGGWVQLLDTTSSTGDLFDVDLSVAPANGQVLKWNGTAWAPANDLTGGGGGGLALTDLSVQSLTPSAGGSLTYNDGSGVFSYTAPDLSGYLTSIGDAIQDADFTTNGLMKRTAAGTYTSTTDNSSNWDTAFGWGNHAVEGYLTQLPNHGLNSHTGVTLSGESVGQLLQYNGTNWVNWTPTYISSYTETDTLATVTGRGASTSNSIFLGDNTKLGFGSNGARGDVELYFDSINTRFTFEDVSGCEFRFQNNVGGNATAFNFLNGGSTLASMSASSVSLWASGTQRFETTSTGVTVTGALTAGGLTYPTTNGTNGDVLTSDGAGNVTWAAPTGGGGGANVTISDTIPAGAPAAGDLWWESDTGRLKVYYTDVDSSQWVDTNPPLSYENINGVVSANGFKFRTNLSSPPAGTLGELRQIDSKPHFFDGTSWQEIILGSTSAITLPAETAWDNVIVRTTFDNDANDYRFGATGVLDTLSFASIATSTLVESPVKVGTKALKSLGSGVKYPHRSEYLFSGEFTIEFWIYFDDANISSTTNSGEQEIISKSNGSFNAGSWSLITTKDAYGNRNWELKNHNIATNAVSKLILEATSGVGWAANYSQQWVHIAITKDNNGALHFYRNGTENNQTTPGTKFANDISNNNYDLIIGGGVNTTTNCFDGFIDGLRITTDTRYDSIGTNGAPAFTPPTTILPISGSTTTYTPPATSSAGSFTLGASPAWTGTLGVTVAQQSSGNYRLTFANPFTNATDYYVFAHHMDGAEAMVVASVRSTGYVDFSVKNVAGSLIDTGSLAVQIIAH